jgi:uncharacterized protein (TIGR03086 family)
VTAALDAHEVHRRAAAEFDARVAAIGDDDWRRPTPCEEWDVRAVVHHLVYDNVWAPPLFDGATIDQVGDRFEGDLLGDDPKQAWSRSIAEALTAAERTPADQTVHLSFADVPASEYLNERATDLAVHGWDLATALGIDDTIPDPIAVTLLDLWEPRVELLGGSGLFAEPVAVPDGADNTTKLVSLLGRRRDARSVG